MGTPLDRVLESLHPDRTLDEVDRRADEAINSFSVPSSRITDWEAFRSCAIRFMRHVEGRILRIQGTFDYDPGMAFDWGRCCRILCREYGPNGEKAAFEMARTGNDGGLYGVLKRIARSMAKEFAEAEIRARVFHYWNGLSVDEKLEAGDEYLEKYGHLLPSELTESSAARVRANMPKVLEEHPKMLRRLEELGRA